MAFRHVAPDPSAHASSPRSPADRRPEVDAVLRAHVHGRNSGEGGGLLTERRVAERARDAAEAIRPLLGEPPRSLHRIRAAILPVLTCPWPEFDAAYEAALEALLALPPARPDVEDPAWDAHLSPDVGAKRARALFDPSWTVPEQGGEIRGPRGTAGRIARQTGSTILLTGDGRMVRSRNRCACELRERHARSLVPYEEIHLGRSGAIVDVVAGIACGSCRAICD